MRKDLSIIIPVLNEEEVVGNLLSQLDSLGIMDKLEVIVVDGGSQDKTIQRVEDFDVRLVSSEKGRSKQMNAGAKMATSDFLFFLHIDSRVPNDFDELIIQEFESGADCGSFELAFDFDHLLLSIYAWFTRFDLNLFRFGDQGFFIRKSIFEMIGGYDESLLLMEDQDIVIRAKRKGEFRLIHQKIITSSRKYVEQGIVKTQIVFTVILILHYLGINQKTLKQFHGQVFNKQ